MLLFFKRFEKKYIIAIETILMKFYNPKQDILKVIKWLFSTFIFQVKIYRTNAGRRNLPLNSIGIDIDY